MIEAIRDLTVDMPVGGLAARGALVGVGAEPMVIGVSRITPFLTAPDTDAKRATVLHLGPQADGRASRDPRTELSHRRSPFRGRRRYRRCAGTSALPALDIFGKTLGNYRWTPPTPGDAVLRSVLPPITVALALFCVVAFVTAFRARKIAMALTQSEQEALVAARTDGMTGLKNRTGFNELLDSPDYQGACKAGELAVIYLDINGFKAVNDSIGHHGGDELVKALTARLNSVLPPEAVFARIGGDEFAIVLTGKSVRDTAAGAASAVVHGLDQPFTIHGFEFHVTVAVGYAVAGAPASRRARSSAAPTSPCTTPRTAPSARRSPTTRRWKPAPSRRSRSRLRFAVRWRRATSGSTTSRSCAPADLTIVGVEASSAGPRRSSARSRRRSSSRSPRRPGSSTTSAASSSTGPPRICSNWPGLKMAINVSPVQLRDPNFADDILGIVDRYGLSPHQFELELTEGILVNNPTIAKRKLAHLKNIGFILSLDDFGTGFSSIGYLRQFPFDILKVDRSFVRDLGINSTANALIQSLVSLGDAMDLSVIAEGIENEDQLKLLRLVQCEYVQGFLISRPIPADGDHGVAGSGSARSARFHDRP